MLVRFGLGGQGFDPKFWLGTLSVKTKRSRGVLIFFKNVHMGFSIGFLRKI